MKIRQIIDHPVVVAAAVVFGHLEVAYRHGRSKAPVIGMVVG